MGKRSTFPRRLHDAYQTFDPRPVRQLMPHLAGVRTFAEPCAGEGRLVEHLTGFGLACTYSGDILTGQDALALTAEQAGNPDVYITNPPWTRQLLYPLILHLQQLGPTWLLLDADWASNVEAAPYLARTCSHILPVGRVQWMPGSGSTGKDNAAWYRFHAQHRDGPRLIPRRSLKGGSLDDHAH